MHRCLKNEGRFKAPIDTKAAQATGSVTAKVFDQQDANVATIDANTEPFLPTAREYCCHDDYFWLNLDDIYFIIISI